MSGAPHVRSRRGSGVSEADKNNSSLCGDQADVAFRAPAFSRRTDGVAGDAAHNRRDEDDEKDLPSNLLASHSNVPGMTPAALMAAHRRSIAAIPGNEDRGLDMHSLTLSRHQVEPQDVYRADMDDMPDDEFQECLNSFKFGEQAAGESIHEPNPA